MFAPYLSISDPEMLGPSNRISPICLKPDLWMSDMYNHGHYSGSEVDWLLDVSRTSDESMLFMALETILHGTMYPVPGVASPTETIFTPGLDEGAFNYLTPSTMYFDSPQIGECLTLPGLGATMLNQAVKAKRLASNQSTHSQITPVMTRSNQTILHLLQSCVFS